MDVFLRQARLEDLDRCYFIEKQCFPIGSATKQRIGKRIELFPEGFVLAEHENKIAAMVNCGCINKEDLSDELMKEMKHFYRDGKNLVIFSLAVLPEFQGKGIGTKLLNEIINRFQNKEKIMLLCQEHNIRFYTQFRFSEKGMSHLTYDGLRLHEMWKVL